MPYRRKLVFTPSANSELETMGPQRREEVLSILTVHPLTEHDHVAGVCVCGRFDPMREAFVVHHLSVVCERSGKGKPR